MRIPELIAKLEAVQDEYGDVEVVFTYNGGWVAIETVADGVDYHNGCDTIAILIPGKS
jgi:hypothetical protein